MKYTTWVLAFFLFTLTACDQQISNSLDYDEILAQLSLDSEGKTEVVKEFPDSFPEKLVKKGAPTVYTRENSSNFEYIGMPVGGIGAGQLYLGGDGQLWFWDIFSLNHNHGQFKGEEAYEFPYKRSEINKYGAREIDQGFSISTLIDGEEITIPLNREGFRNIEFTGQYPIGTVKYSDNKMPLEVQMQAYSPFIPLDLDNSILPATIIELEIKNTSDRTLEVNVNAWLENAVLNSTRKSKTGLQGSLINQITEVGDHGVRLECTVGNIDEMTMNSLDHGSMSLTILSEEGIQTEDFKSIDSIALTDNRKIVGNLKKSIELPSGHSSNITAILTWYFPKTYATQNKWKQENDVLEGADSIRYYASLFDDASGVSEHLINKLSYLSGTTKKWHETWYSSTLPYWFLDRTFLNTSILASSTISVVGKRLYYGTEGGNQGPGTCTHVYGYTQAPGRLFPELEKSIREQVDFVPVSEGGALTPEGIVRFRWFNHGMAVDGQAGIIMKSYQIHQMSPDNDFLFRNYPAIKSIMQGLIDNNDADNDGILTGAQHNTLDADWYGKVPWLSLYYTAALRAMSKMADETGDADYAVYCLKMADMGRKYIEDHLFNGEYFFHEADSAHTESPGTYTGLEYSQLLGQSWAYQVGLGEIINPEKTQTALMSMWRYNFTTDVDTFRKVHTEGRWYAMPGEGGLIACTWPRGGEEVLLNGDPRFAAYNNECQNGYEYAASSLMMWHGMPYHSLAHIWYMDQNRYHGSKRNPYCEIEWGIHYARSMASYGHFIAVSGFEYHGPKGYLTFAPKITPWEFKSAFTAAEGWGTIEQAQTKKKQTNKIRVVYGKLSLNELKLRINSSAPIKDVSILIEGIKPESHFKQQGDTISIRFNDGLVLLPNKELTVEIRGG